MMTDADDNLIWITVSESRKSASIKVYLRTFNTNINKKLGNEKKTSLSSKNYFLTLVVKTYTKEDIKIFSSMFSQNFLGNVAFLKQFLQISWWVFAEFGACQLD